jgi:hypothetical protein
MCEIPFWFLKVLFGAPDRKSRLRELLGGRDNIDFVDEESSHLRIMVWLRRCKYGLP